MVQYTPPPPALAKRACELRSLGLPNAQVKFDSGRKLTYRFFISPSDYGRVYECELQVSPDGRPPEMFVLQPCLSRLTDEKLPHIYPHTGVGTKLCLWWPKQREWQPQMKLSETYIPWTAEWLWYFEDWLTTGYWAGGGEHPRQSEKRWPGKVKFARTR